jgi:hypothetical protein
MQLVKEGRKGEHAIGVKTTTIDNHYDYVAWNGDSLCRK